MVLTGWINVTLSLQLVQLHALGWGWAGLTAAWSLRISSEAVYSPPVPQHTGSLHSWGALYFVIINFNWKLITLQYCHGFCHTLTWISHGCTCVPHPEPPSFLPPHPITQGHPSAPALSALSHALNLAWQSIWRGNIHVSMLFSQIIPPSPSPTESKSLFYISVFLLLSHI